MECAVQVVEVYDVQLESLSNVRPIQDGIIELFLKTKYLYIYRMCGKVWKKRTSNIKKTRMNVGKQKEKDA